jgi:hypothetical protein
MLSLKGISLNKTKKVIDEIISVNSWLASFWTRSHGWAPQAAAELMSKSRLDYQVALSHTLSMWLKPNSEEELSGRLILSWANLGALIEGTLKLFLCAYYEDYSNDLNAYRDRNDKLKDPDSLTLEKIRVFFNKNDLWSDEWNTFVFNVQQKRNAIHAFEYRDIGTFDEFYECLSMYLKMIDEFNLGLPYPDEVAVPYLTPSLWA